MRVCSLCVCGWVAGLKVGCVGWREGVHGGSGEDVCGGLGEDVYGLGESLCGLRWGARGLEMSMYGCPHYPCSLGQCLFMFDFVDCCDLKIKRSRVCAPRLLA